MQHVAGAARTVLRSIPGLEVAEIENGDRCCGSAGLYNVFEPEMADELMRQKATAVAATGCPVVLAANPGCAVQIAAGLSLAGSRTEVLSPAELLDRAYRADTRRHASG